MNTTSLSRLLARQYEVRWGRYFVRSLFAGLGVVAYCLGLSFALFTDANGVVLMAGQGLGLMIGGGLFWLGFPVSASVFRDIKVTSSDLSQIERDEGWFDKGLSAMFYSANGNLLPSEFNGELTVELASAGHDFRRVALAVCRPGREVEYSLADVVLLVQSSGRLSTLEIPVSDLEPHITNRAMAYVVCTVMVGALPVCLGAGLLVSHAFLS